MADELLNVIMKDGSRQFGGLPQTVLWHKLRDHLGRLDGAAGVGAIVSDAKQKQDKEEKA